jgi:hypothetical protein
MTSVRFGLKVTRFGHLVARAQETELQLLHLALAFLNRQPREASNAGQREQDDTTTSHARAAELCQDRADHRWLVLPLEQEIALEKFEDPMMALSVND